MTLVPGPLRGRIKTHHGMDTGTGTSANNRRRIRRASRRWMMTITINGGAVLPVDLTILIVVIQQGEAWAYGLKCAVFNGPILRRQTLSSGIMISRMKEQ